MGFLILVHFRLLQENTWVGYKQQVYFAQFQRLKVPDEAAKHGQVKALGFRILTMSSHNRKRAQELSEASFITALIPFRRTLPS